jgi:RNA polymerase sigma factor (sigma-70 family)
MSQSEPPGDWRTYAADLFSHHELVVERLAKQNPSVDRDDLHDAFVKAILEVAADPAKFDTSRDTRIEDFLAGAAQRALLQTLRTHRRRKNREEINAELVASDRPAARLVVDTVADAELARQAREVAETDEERNVLQLWELGHPDAEIADRLGKPLEEVRRIRDRVTHRLRRLGDQFSNDNTL